MTITLPILSIHPNRMGVRLRSESLVANLPALGEDKMVEVGLDTRMI